MDYNKYFTNLECAYWHEFDQAYGKLDVKNKTITIIGHDCGSTDVYFFLRGALKIIGFEKEDKLNKLFKEKVCKDFNICDKVEINGEWKGDIYPDTDIFIIDCEGCEKNLKIEQLQKYKQYCIAIHDWTKNRTELLRKLSGLIFTFVTDDGKEIILCKL
ncbi:putative methyltransferase [Sulfolobales Beppu rod-shaped virus 1]|uniref:Putative methyltransferase n=1 Tax=Sulfolobales Beppu rod-shaped virus 1 TaxID=2493121 RepID=A0A3S8NFC2_9VIRU|nr:putative methyltransferase [Sulfolobales Beppu rod-shaped virus 1]AZI75935.1 putative methyltransferase [Sulfolobales Beppu rod-shaped virus 1]